MEQEKEQDVENDPLKRISSLIGPHESLGLVDRSVGCLLTAMIGDILGASCEGYLGWNVRTNSSDGKIRDFVQTVHMGVEELGKRYGMYTDDTNSTLALATSLVQNSGLNPKAVALKYAEFWRDAEPKRGYPGSAQAVIKAILKGEDYNKTGTICFPDGSFANGGAMKISPIGLAFRNANDIQLYEAVRLAIISSHVHPEAVDGAFIQAKAITLLLKETPKSFDSSKFLQTLYQCARTDSMKEKIKIIEMNLHLIPMDDKEAEVALLGKLGDDFQIKAVEAVACALWSVVRNYLNPEETLVETVAIGGDTDTIASMAGAMIGSLYGTQWIPARWYDNIEDKKYGRTYCIELANQLSKLDLSVPLEDA